MPSFFSKLLGRPPSKAKSPAPSSADEQSLLEGRFEAVQPPTPITPTSPGPSPTTAGSANGKGAGAGGGFLQRVKSTPMSPPASKPKPAPKLNSPSPAPAPHLTLNLGGGGVGGGAKGRSLFDLALEGPVDVLSEAELGKRVLSVEDATRLVRLCGACVGLYGLDTPGLMHPHWYAADPSAQRRLISLFLADSANFEDELRTTRSPHDVAAVLRWGLRHISRTKSSESASALTTAYTTFASREKDAGYPLDAFERFLSPSLLPSFTNEIVSSEATKDLLSAVLEVFSALAAHAEANGVSGSKACMVLGWWIFAFNVGKAEEFETFYGRWERAGRMMEHLFLASVRQETIGHTLPKRLTELVKAYPYGPQTPDGLLARPRFSTRRFAAIYVRVASGAASLRIHPVRLIELALGSASANDQEGEAWTVWTAVLTEGKEREGRVFEDETMRILEMVPGNGRVQLPVVVAPTGTNDVSAPKLTHERGLSYESTITITPSPTPARNAGNGSGSNPLGIDWAQFSTSGFLDGTLPLASTLMDKDIEVTTPPPVRRNSSRKDKRPTSPGRKSLDMLPPIAIPPPKAVPASDEKKEANGKVLTVALTQVDEAFIDFWNDTLLDPAVMEGFPPVVVGRLRRGVDASMSTSTSATHSVFLAHTEKVEWVVIEHVRLPPKPAPAPAPIAAPLPAPAPSTSSISSHAVSPPSPITATNSSGPPTSPASSTTKGKKRFSFWRSGSAASVSSLNNASPPSKGQEVDEFGVPVAKSGKDKKSKRKSVPPPPHAVIPEDKETQAQVVEPVNEEKDGGLSGKAVAAGGVALAVGGVAAVVAAGGEEDTKEEEEEKPTLVEESKADIIEESTKPAEEVEASPPAVVDESPAPAEMVEGSISAPVVVAEDPVAAEEAFVPVVDATVPAPIAPTLEVVEEPEVEEHTESSIAVPVEEAAVPEPVDDAPVAEPVEDKPAFVVEEESVAPIVEAEPPAPVAQEASVDEPVKDKPAFVVEEESIAPILEAERAAPAVEEELVNSTVEAEPATPVQEKPAFIVEEESIAPLVEEASVDDAPIVEKEPTPGPEETPSTFEPVVEPMGERSVPVMDAPVEDLLPPAVPAHEEEEETPEVAEVQEDEVIPAAEAIALASAESAHIEDSAPTFAEDLTIPTAVEDVSIPTTTEDVPPVDRDIAPEMKGERSMPVMGAPVEDLLPPVASEEAEIPTESAPEPEHESVDTPAVEEVAIEEAPVAEEVAETAVAAVEEDALAEEAVVVEEEPAPVVAAVEEPTAAVEDEPTPVVEDAPTPVVEEGPTPIIEETLNVPVVDEPSPEPPVEEMPAVIEAPVVEDPEPVAEPTPQPIAESEPEPVAESEPKPVAELELEPVVEDQSTPVVEEALAEPIADVTPAAEPLVKDLEVADEEPEAEAPVVEEPTFVEEPQSVEALALVDSEVPAAAESESPAVVEEPVEVEAEPVADEPTIDDLEAPAVVEETPTAALVEEIPVPVVNEPTIEEAAPAVEQTAAEQVDEPAAVEEAPVEVAESASAPIVEKPAAVKAAVDDELLVAEEPAPAVEAPAPIPGDLGAEEPAPTLADETPEVVEEISTPAEPVALVEETPAPVVEEIPARIEESAPAVEEPTPTLVVDELADIPVVDAAPEPSAESHTEAVNFDEEPASPVTPEEPAPTIHDEEELTPVAVEEDTHPTTSEDQIAEVSDTPVAEDGEVDVEKIEEKGQTPGAAALLDSVASGEPVGETSAPTPVEELAASVIEEAPAPTTIERLRAVSPEPEVDGLEAVPVVDEEVAVAQQSLADSEVVEDAPEDDGLPTLTHVEADVEKVEQKGETPGVAALLASLEETPAQKDEGEMSRPSLDGEPKLPPGLENGAH